MIVALGTNGDREIINISQQLLYAVCILLGISWFFCLIVIWTLGCREEIESQELVQIAKLKSPGAKFQFLAPYF